MVLEDARNEAERAVALVEGAIRSLGVDPASARAGGDGRTTQYALRRGSARVLVAVHAGDGAGPGSLRVAAPVVKLPEAAMRPALFQHLLELNARELAGAAFGLLGDEVVVVGERTLTDLDASEVDALVRTVGRIADHWDDALASRFGAKRSSD